MDFKWLRPYEREGLFGVTIRSIDYSPEIDTYLDIFFFPAFEGHCGGILFDRIYSYRKLSFAEKLIATFMLRLMKMDIYCANLLYASMHHIVHYMGQLKDVYGMYCRSL